MTNASVRVQSGIEQSQSESEAPGIRFLLGSLALQNLGRRKIRTVLVLIAVAVCSGAIFAGSVVMRSIESSMIVGFTRLGADMLIVPEGTLTNITAALLTAEPTEQTLDKEMVTKLAALKGINRVAPQLVFRTELSGYGQPDEPVDMIAFDPDRDITVQPWLDGRLNRPIRENDVIIGASRDERLGSEILLFGKPLTVYGKLGKTAVGTHERGLFVTFATLDGLRQTMMQICGKQKPLEPDRLSGVLVELAPGRTTTQVRFAVLASFPDVKVVSGESMLTSIRQGLSALLNGVLALMIVMFLSTAAMIGVLFSVLITERRRELGLLMAIGARPGQILGLLLTESALATALGGLLGCALGALLLRAYDRSLVYYLDGLGIPFFWLGNGETLMIAFACILLATLVGAVGAIYPAWQASRQEPYDLVRSEG